MTPSANLAALLEDRATGLGWGPRAAFLAGDRVVTHAEVHAGAGRAAAVLAESGVGRGDRVLLVLGDGMELVWAFLATVRLGALAVPVNPRLTAGDHRYLARDCRARLVVCGADLADRFDGLVEVLTAGGLAERLPSHDRHPAAEVGPAEPAYAQYTSGTTGRPRAAVHRHGDPPVYFRAFAGPALGLRPDDVVLSVSRLFFAYGLGNTLFFPLLGGCRAVLHAGPAGEVPALAGRHGVTVLFGVPTFYARVLAAHPDGFGALRVAVSAGETLTVALARRIERALGCPVLDGLGSTEVGQTFVSNTLGCRREGTVGRALAPYQVAVRDGDGRDL
ncbi:MAG: AMP-binding protein, partial [Actinobacteria bacterium]|nr:AMP-binding protein [Actinomycetota bacterium]